MSGISVSHYSPSNGELLGVTVAEVNPANPDPIIPSFATSKDAPIAPDGMRSVFLNQQGVPPILEADGEWSLKVDQRGMVYWLPDGTKHEVTELGSVPPVDALSEKPVDPPPTEAELSAAATRAVGNLLDVLAKSWQYTSYQSARTYKGDIVPKYAAEGEAISNYGSKCYEVLDKIASGIIEKPSSIDGLLALMPAAPDRPVLL